MSEKTIEKLMPFIDGGRRKKSITIRKTSASVVAALFVGLIVFVIFWLIPLANLGAITTPYQNPDFSDSNFYLYNAAYNCAAPPSQREYQVTWSSTGVVAYLTYSCLMTTHYLGFIIINTLLIFLAYTYYLNSFKKQIFSSGIIITNALSIYTFALLLAPGKEIISFVGLCFVAGGMIRHGSDISVVRGSIKNYPVIAIGILILSLSRLHEGAIIIAGIFIYLIIRKFGYIAAISTLALFLIFIDAIAKYLLGVELNTLLYFGQERSGGISYYLSEILTSHNPFINALLAPLRIIVVPLGSFLQLVSERTIQNQHYFFYRDILQRFRAIDMTIFLVAMYCSFKWRREPAFASVVIILVSLSAITWTGILEKSRYYFVYLPLLTPFISMRQRSQS